ncbi:hypothetical protein GCM10025856_23460 [Methylophaga marina]|uniref:VPLPA-CTERM sorting domain-containing protein n=1 Tax=Methylophaga marina TaxID=45495 RepID=A0ABP3D943_9GAMM|nr:hypothetical protein [Methylophaga marina]BDZ74627.1 hypothetical protein GCM10025856_23460 [Methylophaga marina]
MKKVMLFIFAFTFSVGVNAATLNLSTEDSFLATQVVDTASGSTVSGSGEVKELGGVGKDRWYSQYNIKSVDANTPVKIEWSFEPQANLESATLGFGLFGGAYTTIDIIGNTSFIAFLEQGKVYALDIFDASGSKLEYKVSVSAVPVPAALFLFAPALLGFLGLRRKSAVAA